jgi:hypothetical protein
MPATPFTTDEQVYLLAPEDYAMIVPQDQRLASGRDGAFAGNNRWKLTSATVNFLGQGVQPGQSVVLTVARPHSPFGTRGDVMIVDSVASDGVTLRRPGLASGVGDPPSPDAGTTGVIFSVLTLAPQIESESYRIAQQFGISDSIRGSGTADLADPRQLAELAALRVLHWRYMATVRSTEDPVWREKGATVRTRISDLEPSVRLAWGTDPVESQSTGMHATRISR